MTITVIGTPDSGKSKKAEEIVCRLSDETERYYIATMIPFGTEGADRVNKHRQMREGKGFVTIEQPFDAAEALAAVSEPETATVLLECVSNLAANEMFERKCEDIPALAGKIAEDLKRMQASVKNLVIVSNRFAEEPGFDEETRQYVHLMDLVNRELKALSDECIEL